MPRWLSTRQAAIPTRTCRTYKTGSGVSIDDLYEGKGPEAQEGSKLVLDYVLRRSNGYFIYSTVEGVSFQPKDVPIGPYEFTLVNLWLDDGFSCCL